MPETMADPPVAGPEPALRSLYGELVPLVVEQERRTWPAVIVSAAAMAGLMAAYVPLIYPAAWFLMICAATVAHMQLLASLLSDSNRSDDRKLTLAAWSFSMHAAALISLMGFFPFVPVTTGTIITIFGCGLCTATIPSTLGFRRIFLPYSLITLGPIVVLWLVLPGMEATLYERLSLAALVTAYFFAMQGHAKGAYRAYMETYHFQLQRVELNRKLRDALGTAESANRAKTRFLASASHDLRQPIHALSLFSGSLLLRPLDQRSGGIAVQIDKAVKSLASQLDALLDISRLDAGVIEKSISAVDLRTLLSQLIDEFKHQAENKNLRLEMLCADGLMIRSDPMLLQQILRNLLSNAVKYTDAGSIRISAEAGTAGCRIVVADTGSGIPLAEHERIFEEFYQLQNPERDRAKGLGLGLAIVRRLTALLDIELGMDSAPGLGSRFSIELPLAGTQDALPADVEPAASAVSQNISVLVVDDEEAIRLGMKTLLEEMGFAVCVTGSTEGAIDAARRFTPSIVLADLRLRGADNGIRAIESLRIVWPALPALLVSGDTAPDRLREAREAGVELLHKPVSASLLRESVLKAVRAGTANAIV